jgi:hypothetical protein
MASIDLIEEVRKEMGYGPLPKINPNTQTPESVNTQSPNLGSAVIPAVLVGFYKHTRNDEQAAQLMAEKDADLNLETLFGEERDSTVRSVANYAGVALDEAEAVMKNAVAVTKDILRRAIKNPDGKTVSSFFSRQRSNILKHLPVDLNMGGIMKDSSMDDRTNKMEGPMSGMMHTIEKIFSSTK